MRNSLLCCIKKDKESGFGCSTLCPVFAFQNFQQVNLHVHCVLCLVSSLALGLTPSGLV